MDAEKTRKIIGRRIHLSRKEAALTLRELSIQTGLSPAHISRIERGLVHARANSIERLLRVLGIDFHFDHALHDKLSSLSKPLYHDILYVDYTRARQRFDKLFEAHDKFSNSLVAVDYHLVMLMTAVHLQMDREWIEAFYRPLSVMEDLMDDAQHELFLLEKGIYSHLLEQYEEARALFQQTIELGRDSHLQAIAYYMHAIAVFNDYTRFHEALSFLDSAVEIFSRYSNFERLNRAKSAQQTLYIYLHRFDRFEQSYADTMAYARRHGALALYHFTQLNRARYHVVRGNYEAATETLESFTLPVCTYYLLKMYAAFIEGRYAEAQAIYEDYEHGADFPRQTEMDLLEAMGFAVEGKEERYIEALSTVVDKAFQTGDFLVSMLAVELYLQVLKQQRRYKEAYLKASQYLSMLRKTK